MATTLPDLSGTAPQLPPGVSSHYVMVGDIRTHYLEAGQGEPIILLHSAEFGGRAEFSWRYTIPGHGCGRWIEIFKALKGANFKGAVCVELEDENFNGTEDGEKAALIHSLNFLRSA